MRGLLILGSLLLLGVGSFVSLAQLAPSGSKAPVSGSSGIPLPEFAQANQASAYREAMRTGNERSVRVLDDALARAASRRDVDPEYVARLQALRARNAENLRALERAK
jgi:hypothetical protein